MRSVSPAPSNQRNLTPAGMPLHFHGMLNTEKVNRMRLSRLFPLNISHSGAGRLKRCALQQHIAQTQRCTVGMHENKPTTTLCKWSGNFCYQNNTSIAKDLFFFFTQKASKSATNCASLSDSLTGAQNVAAHFTIKLKCMHFKQLFVGCLHFKTLIIQIEEELVTSTQRLDAQSHLGREK